MRILLLCGNCEGVFVVALMLLFQNQILALSGVDEFTKPYAQQYYFYLAFSAMVLSLSRQGIVLAVCMVVLSYMFQCYGVICAKQSL